MVRDPIRPKVRLVSAPAQGPLNRQRRPSGRLFGYRPPVNSSNVHLWPLPSLHAPVIPLVPTVFLSEFPSNNSISGHLPGFLVPFFCRLAVQSSSRGSQPQLPRDFGVICNPSHTLSPQPSGGTGSWPTGGGVSERPFLERCGQWPGSHWTVTD